MKIVRRITLGKKKEDRKKRGKEKTKLRELFEGRWDTLLRERRNVDEIGGRIDERIKRVWSFGKQEETVTLVDLRKRKRELAHRSSPIYALLGWKMLEVRERKKHFNLELDAWPDGLRMTAVLLFDFSPAPPSPSLPPFFFLQCFSLRHAHFASSYVERKIVSLRNVKIKIVS